MNYRKLGHAGIKLSEIGLGSWLTYGYGVKAEAGRACIRKAFDLGVNFFDTADVYHRGAAETFLGNNLRAFRRRNVVIATKCFFPMSEQPNDAGLSRKHIVESLHDSLKRLRTDYVDLYQCHRFDPEVELQEIVRTMDDLVRQGKVLYWGVSEWSAEQIRRLHETARALNAVAPVSNQPEYSLAARRVETNGVQHTCAELGLGMVLWSPLKQGILTGKYSGGKVSRGTRAASPKMRIFMRELDRNLLERVDRLRPIAERRGLSLAQLAITWLLTRPAVTSVVVGATRPEQVKENCKLPEVALTCDDLREIDALFPAEQFP